MNRLAPLRNITRRTSTKAVSSLDHSSSPEDATWLFIDSVFPIQLARWDLRRFIGTVQEDSLLATLRTRLAALQEVGYDIVRLQPQPKDGGVFVLVRPQDDKAPPQTPEYLEERLLDHPVGHLPSWAGLNGGKVWVVKGKPWLEDMDRYASKIVKVSFDGPDVAERDLFQIFRQYGRISDITPPSPGPSGSLRSSFVMFDRIRSASVARNVLDGFKNVDAGTATKLRTAYEKKIHGHVIRNWLASHPKLVFPVVVFLLGTLTYTIFDPIRALMVKAKMLEWFDPKAFKLYRWLRVTALDKFTFANVKTSSAPEEQIWKEREDAQVEIEKYLDDLPSTVSFLHGPQGSGKFNLLQDVLSGKERSTLVIDCKQLQGASSDSQLIATLAKQTGYRPMFTFLNSANSLIDLASVGIIGQKTGFSSSLEEQLQQVLSVVTSAITSVAATHMDSVKHEIVKEDQKRARKADAEVTKDRIRRGIWHDGRLDCVAGNGVMSELGIGDELFGDVDAIEFKSTSATTGGGHASHEKPGKATEKEYQQSAADAQAVKALPVVIVRNYELKGNDVVLKALAQWAASLAENKIAHVVVISDNRENLKRLARALPSKPLISIPLYDADAESALAFVKKRLAEADIHIEYAPEQVAHVNQLGGRASDLESLVHKVRSGLTIEQAVDDIINRAVSEIRKTAFGDDSDDMKNLPWTREQAWTILNKLSRQPEIPYHHLLVDFPFKGDDAALRELEHAELISVTAVNGRPSMIRPGKPIFRYVFERLAEDKIFKAIQDMNINNAIIVSSETTVQRCEEELTKIKDLEVTESSKRWQLFGGKSATSARMQYLFAKMMDAETKIEDAERRNVDLKNILAKDKHSKTS